MINIKLHFFIELAVQYTIKLDSIYKEIESCQKAKEFVNEFKDKIIVNLETKPKQDLKSFLNNFENLMTQHKKKMMKTSKIDLIDQNYEQILVLTLYILLEEKIFECQILDAVRFLKLETFDQIKNSLIVKSGNGELEEGKEQSEIIIHTDHYTKCLKNIIRKAVEKLTKPMRPLTSKSLRKDIENQINNI